MAKPAFAITIINAEKIIQAFKAAPELMSPALTNAINRSLLSIGREATRNAPVRTGHLRASILRPGAGLMLAAPGFFQGSVGSAVGYGYFVEFGTRYMDAQPFLTSAVADTEADVQENFTEAVETVLNEIGEAA